MTIHTTIRRQLFWGLDRKPLVVAFAGAAFGAAATVAVVAGWSAFGPAHAVEGSGSTSAATFANNSTGPNYPVSRDGVRGPIDVDSGSVVEAARPISLQPNYPVSREGVRGPVDVDSGFAAEAAQPISRQPNYPASREGVRGLIAPE